MHDDLISLLESENDRIKEVLSPHLHEKIHKRLLGGFFDETKKRFIAFAFFPLKKSMYYEYDYLFDLTNNGHSAFYYLPETVEKTKKYLDNNSFQYKTTEELIEDGTYKSLLVTYTGEFDFDEWNILPNCFFSDTKDKNRLLNSKLDRFKNSLKDYFVDDPIFEEASAYHVQMMSRVSSTENLPVLIPAHLKPFVGHSTLVAFVRAERKSKLNLSFHEYIKKAICEPLIKGLKTDAPDQYRTVWGFYGYDCNFLIPSSRQFCLILFVATDKRKKSSTQFYLYNLKEDKLYKWIYFDLFPYKEKPDYDLIVKIFSPISQLDSMDYINDPRCNFDDSDFWNNFIFKRDNNKYLYLKEKSRVPS